MKKECNKPMEWTGLNELREKFLHFFEEKGHLRLPSFPLIPQGDNSLLLINSGMAPMKKWFLGQEEPPRHRVTTCQKCIRTPDIENVGKTARHGTFFEMLGNFSFGDYFKHEATKWAWEFITQELKMPVDKLWVSIYEGDEETRKIWVEEVGVAPDRIVTMGKEDNFWEIGAGPCGPCSEIYFDRGPEKGCGKPDCHVGCECDRYVEFWNLVFSQFDGDGNGNYTPMAHPNIDTGMGLERLACIMQGVDNLFEVDTIQNIMKKISEIAGVHYHEDEAKDVSLRVITDHIRSTVFMLADGVIPSNEGRGYVLRRLLRRAARHGRLLGINGPFLYQVVDTVVKENHTAYPELAQKQSYLEKIILTEEENFDRTLNKGLELLNQLIDKAEEQGISTLAGEDAFHLYDTFGFPIDLTREIASEKGFAIDETAFGALMEHQKEVARQARMSQEDVAWADETLGLHGVKTEFTGYGSLTGTGKVLAMLVEGEKVEEVSAGTRATMVFDSTCFYAESGGQVADKGTISTGSASGQVLDVQKTGTGLSMHVVQVEEGTFHLGDTVEQKVYKLVRYPIMRNHTAAHLLQAALRQVLGDHVHQAGQLVTAPSLRFDFSHFEAMTPDQIHQVEGLVNQKIFEAIPVTVEEMPIEEARKTGAMALFGEKYGNTVRVVSVDDFSKEFCGGTHVANTAHIGLFKIVSEGSVAAGVRRIEAVTGNYILELLQHNTYTLHQAAKALKLNNTEELVDKCAALTAELKEAKAEVARLNAQLAQNSFAKVLRDSLQEVDGIQYTTMMLENMDLNALKDSTSQMREHQPDLVFVAANITEGKGNLICVVGDNAKKRGLKAGNIVREVAKFTGGKGGGRPDQAMAGVGDVTKVDEALLQLKDVIVSQLG